jgi:tetratricopeptide (TPR) repeat protein
MKMPIKRLTFLLLIGMALTSCQKSAWYRQRRFYKPVKTSPQSAAKPYREKRTMKLKSVVFEPHPEDMRQAKILFNQSEDYYRKGAYFEAEGLLKEAITIYPFLAPANLMLGKIYLIRGSAVRDPVLLENARMMFEMAKALEPTAKESDLLLELFQYEELIP